MDGIAICGATYFSTGEHYMQPTISVIIPSIGMGYLLRTLRSIKEQGILPGDEVLIIGDTVNDQLDDVRAIAAIHGPQVKYYPHNAGGHHWGNPQRNYGLTLCTGDYVSFMDDDDVYAPNAFDAIRSQISRLSEPQVLMFRFRTPWRTELWQEKQIVQGSIGGHCIVVPNDKSKFGVWTNRYEGDFDFIRSTVDNWGEENVVWCPELIAVTRPEWE
jgi:glycosyltransferase involved in cell wall biosynthesis